MKRIFAFLLFTALTGVMAFAQMDIQPVAIVRLTRSEPITVRQLRTEIERLSWQEMASRLGRVPTTSEVNSFVQSLGMQDRRQVLDLMINERLALQAAERDRITVTDNELNQQIQQLRSQMAQAIRRQPTEDEFAQAIKNETGLDYPVWRDQTRRQAIVQKYLMSKKEAEIMSVPQPTNAEIESIYNIRKSEFVRPDTIRFTMIQVPYTSDPASRNRARDLADRLNREIGSNPARFDEVVIRGQTPTSEYQAGDGGYLPRNVQAQQAAGTEFITTAFSLRQGEVSRVIDGIGAYQIIKITETYSQRSLDLDDIIQPGSPITVRQFIAESLYAERQQAAYIKAQQDLVIELRAGNSFQIMENNLNW